MAFVNATGVCLSRCLSACGLVVLCVTTCQSAGLSDHTFVLPPNGLTTTEAFVVEDVNGLFARSLGRKLPVVSEKDAPKTNRIYVGRAPVWFDYSRLTGKDAAVVVKGGDVWLFGRGANAVRFAAYDFLVFDLGYRFFDARGGLKVPDLATFRVTDGERIVRYAFPGRSLSVPHLTGREAALFYFRTGLNSRMEAVFAREGYGKGTAVDDFIVPYPYCHGLMEHFPKNRAVAKLEWAKAFARDYDKEMPECFSLTEKGQRNTDHQPCLSHPEVSRVIRRNYFNMIARQERPAYLDLSACDTPGRFCWCEQCRALEEKYGTPGGPLLDLILSFAPEVAARYPDQKLLMLAYRKKQTEIPPKGFARLPDNFVPDFAPIDDDFSKSWLHPNNTNTLENLRGWGRLCKEVLLWYYPNPYGEPVTPPLGNIRRLVDDMRLMKAAGNVSLFFEHNVGVRQQTGFADLQSYLIARLSRDVTLDESELIGEFLDFEYGAAADIVRSYLDELERETAACTRRFKWDAGIGDCEYLTPEWMAKWETSFDAAEKSVAADRWSLRNVRRLRLGLDLALLKKTKDLSVLPRIRAVLNELTEDCFAERYRGEGRSFAKKLETQLRLLEMRFGPNAKPLPEAVFGKVPQELVTVALPISSYGGMVDDADAAYGSAAVLDSAKGRSAAESMKLPFVANVETYAPRATWTPAVGPGVTAENLGPRDAYRFYCMGRTTLTQDLHVEFGCWGLRSHGISEAFKEGAFNKARIYASLKFQGPAFYPEDTRPNKVFCDRVVIVRDWGGEIPPDVSSN